MDLSNIERNRAELQGTRAVIYEYIVDHPGTHVRELVRQLEIGMGDLQYNLDVLEKRGMITARRRGLRKFIFPSGVFGEKQRALLSALSTETERQILIFLAGNPNLTCNQIASLTNLTCATVSWHMKRLLELGLIDRVRVGRGTRYQLLVDKIEIEKFIRSYHPSFWEKLSNRLADIVLDLSTSNSSR
ncbi:MAG: helix-turn-helix domain-containing protein [Nitrososphaerota archaeon]|nr:helix-turn-helix domain-containing protein [Nitrososphaerota archaeon]MDG6999267.1 helix-turn-helix domain-containing protein [Nitrososphaerota archaeon]